jgi:hypothetical protein
MSFIYLKGREEFAKGNLHWNNDVFKAVLVDNTYIPNLNHNFVADIVAHEVSGVGYSRKTLTNNSVATSSAIKRAMLKTDNIVWEGINAGEVSGIILYKSVNDDTDSTLIAFLNGGFPITTNGGNITYVISSNGILNI